MRNYLHSRHLYENCEANLKFRSSLFKGLWVSRGQSPWSQVNLTFSRRAKFPKLTVKCIAAIAKSLTAKKCAIHTKKGKRTMINKVRKTIKCELRHTIFLKNLSLKQKSTNEVSEFEASTQYEWENAV